MSEKDYMQESLKISYVNAFIRIPTELHSKILKYIDGTKLTRTDVVLRSLETFFEKSESVK